MHEYPRGPMIVTAQMGSSDQAWAERLRRAHYPADRNHVPAHITLAHHLAPSLYSELRGTLASMSAGVRPSALIGQLRVSDGHVAIEIRSPELMALRAELVERFEPYLIPQDRAEPRLHITIQNKVTPGEAHDTATRLREQILPRPIIIAALAIWEYRGGPWLPISRHAFRG